ncbi:MAG: ABC transporter ATP-binding protein [Promethearchaeota archaeon]|nr:MAG: ABC transporter ATP-binding protein [Candidatus Lokiarchaeota archaeon]
MIKRKKAYEKEAEFQYEILSNELQKIYGKKDKAFEAVKKINLRIEPGIHGFLGPNGAGKTTTMNMLVGALAITSGEAKIRNEKAGTVEARRLIGFLPQDPVFYDNMTGEEYLIYMGKLGGLNKMEARKRAQELCVYFDIFNDRTRPIGEYSGGMKQKIGIAAALIHKPKLLILDEPTANLDPIGRANIIDKIKEISKTVSVFVSSHILSEIEQMCERVTMINKGAIVISDTLKNIKQQYIGNTYELDTNKNKEMLKSLKQKDYVQNTWIKEEDGTIQIIPQDADKLKQEMPKVILENNAILYSFHIPEISLQDIFMEVYVEKGDKK